MELSCKEEVDISDLELEPENDNDDFKDIDDKPKIRKRRRREVDMIKLSDDEDDESDEEHVGKKIRMSPGHNSPASHREPRTCVLKASQKRRPLSRLLEQLLRNLEKRDPHQFFAWPVNDNFAPNYSKIIKRPMDFSTIKQKIDDNDYKSLNCFIGDFKLMCNNALKYNKLGTVYHKAARRLLHSGLKQLTPQKLRPLASMLTYMYEIPLRELGFDIGKMDVHKILKLRSPNSPSGGSEAEQTSEGGDAAARGAGGDRVKIQMEHAREQHRRRLAKQAFPRMDQDGKTTLCLAVNTVDATGEDKQMTLGQYIGKLSQGTGTLHTLREDRRNFVRGVKPLHYGPFSSYAPAHDGTFASLTKEESHLLYHTLPSETGQGSEELLRFAPDSPWSVIYDMEAMFPDKKSEALPEKLEEADIASMTVSVSELRSLSELGIDMDFLSEIEDDIAASQHDYGLSGALQQTGALISKLNAAQHERLSLPPPAHLSLAPRPSPAERQLARATAAALRQLAARLPPRHVAPLPAVRRAMGVTLAHLDTPITVDDIELHDHSDLDSRSS